MAEGTKPTPRASNPTRTSVQRTLGIITVRRGTVPSGGGSVAIPSKVREFYIKNAHDTVSFGLNFNSDGSSNYWTLHPGKETPLLKITDSITINAKGIGGDSTYEAIFMG